MPNPAGREGAGREGAGHEGAPAYHAGMATLTPPTIRLTDLTTCGGCAAKLGADVLSEALAGLGLDEHGHSTASADGSTGLIAGLDPPDDAAVHLVAPGVSQGAQHPLALRAQPVVAARRRVPGVPLAGQEALRLQPARPHSSLLLGAHQTASGQHLHMLGRAGQGDVERPRQLRDR